MKRVGVTHIPNTHAESYANALTVGNSRAIVATNRTRLVAKAHGHPNQMLVRFFFSGGDPMTIAIKPKSREAKLIAIRVSPQVHAALQAIAAKEGFKSPSGRPHPGAWLESKTTDVIRRAVANAPQAVPG